MENIREVKMTGFNLKEKKLFTNSHLLNRRWLKNYSKVVYQSEDVKEFIKLLKKPILITAKGDRIGDLLNKFNKRIDKLSGGL